MLKLASLLVLTVGLASANTFIWATPVGSSTGGGSVSASATVVTGAGSITVTLNDLLANPTDVGQLISDFSFTLGSPLSTALDTTSTPAGSLIYVSSPNTGDPIDPWNLTSTGATILLERLGATGTPSELIIGPGPYTNANGSIAGNTPHNPFLDGTATFTFAVAGVTADSTVTAATFSFGTTLGNDVTGTCTDCGGGGGLGGVPEPLSLFLMGGGLLGIGIFGKFRRA